MHKPESAPTRNRYARKLVFGPDVSHVAHPAQVFAVVKVDNVLLFELRKSKFHTRFFDKYFVIIYAAGNYKLPAALNLILFIPPESSLRVF